MTYDFQSVNCYAESVCGDSFLCERSEAGVLMVHSDGMGHGHKANVLSELTCEIVMSEWSGLSSIQKVMEMLAYRLPICAVRGLGYSTFTLVDVNEKKGGVTVVEYENPATLFFRDGAIEQLDYQTLEVRWKQEVRETRVARFVPRAGDRLVVVSDGVTQSGVGSKTMPFGWGDRGLRGFVAEVLNHKTDILPSKLNDMIINESLLNEAYYSHDDISAFGVLF